MSTQLDDMRELNKAVELAKSKVFTFTGMQKKLTEQVKTIESKIESLHLSREKNLSEGIQSEKQRLAENVTRKYTAEQRDIRLKIDNLRAETLRNVSALTMVKEEEELRNKFEELRQLETVADSMDEHFLAGFGESIIKLLELRTRNLDIRGLSPKQLSTLVDSYIDTVTQLKRHTPIRKLSLRKVFGVIIFNPAVIGLDSEELVWLWYAWIVLVAVLMFSLGLLAVLPLTILLTVIAVDNFKNFYTLYKLYFPYVQLRKSLEGVDIRVKEIVDSMRKDKERILKNECNKEVRGLVERLNSIPNEIQLEKTRKLQEFSEDSVGELLSDRYEDEIIKLVEQKDAMNKKAEDIGKDIAKHRESLDRLIERQAKLKRTIIESYKTSEVVASSKLLLSEFFLCFDNNIPITLDLRNRSCVIFFRSGSGESELNKVVDLTKSILMQSLIKMDPDCIQISLIDTRSGGTHFSQFTNVNPSDTYSEDDAIFRIVSNSNDVKLLLEKLYADFQVRRDKVISSYSDIEEYNTAKISNNSKTLPYHYLIFYTFDYATLRDDSLKQMIRSSYKLGIIPIIFLDLSAIGDEGGKVNAQEIENLIDVYDSESLRECLYTFEGVQEKHDNRQVTNRSIAKLKAALTVNNSK